MAWVVTLPLTIAIAAGLFYVLALHQLGRREWLVSRSEIGG